MSDRNPPTPVVFEILLSLVDGEKHGYAILQEIGRRTDGRLTPHAGTLYRALSRLVDDGLLVETEGPEVTEDGRRRYYAITPAGLDVARSEADRLELQVRAARAAFDRATG